MVITSITPYMTRDAVPIPEALKARLPEYESVVVRPYFERDGKNDIGFFLTLNSGRGLKYIGSKSVVLMTSDAVTAEALRSIEIQLK